MMSRLRTAQSRGPAPRADIDALCAALIQQAPKRSLPRAAPVPVGAERGQHLGNDGCRIQLEITDAGVLVVLNSRRGFELRRLPPSAFEDGMICPLSVDELCTLG